MADRIRVRLSEMALDLKGEKVKITASFGVVGLEATTTDQKISLESLVNLADKFLYQCKTEGRNRVKGGTLQ